MEQKEFGQRLAQLRMNKRISARKMSYELGHNKNYMTTIENGKAFPSMQEFFYICEYLSVTPEQFYSVNTANPSKVNDLMELAKSMPDEDLDAVISIVQKMKK